VSTLLREGLIEPTTAEERRKDPGFDYRTTSKGAVYAEAIRAVPTPVLAEKPKWEMPS
jgi:hypothetical protein